MGPDICNMLVPIRDVENKCMYRTYVRYIQREEYLGYIIASKPLLWYLFI